MAAGSTRGAPAAPELLSIGEVLTRLRPEFPEVTVSKIRFLEAEGLVEPARTPSGYRKFTEQDLERLSYVLGAQRDQYLPLKVIREHLDAIDRGLEPPVVLGSPRAPSALTAADGMPDARAFARGPREVKLSRAELIESSGCTPELLKRLEDFDLVRAMSGGWYDADALAVAKTVAEMAEFGFEPRHLRAFKTAADREAGLVEQAVAPLTGRRDAQSGERAGEVARELAALSVRLHASLVRRALPSALRG